MPGNFNIKRFGIIALLLILLAVAVEAKFSLTGFLNFVDSAEGMATITIILLLLSAIMAGIDYWLGPNIAAWPNPQVTGSGADPAIISIVNSFIKLLMPFYILAIILTGLYVLFVSGSPNSRAKAKSIFWRLIFSMVLVTISLPIFQIILDVSAALASGMANIMGLNIFYVLLPFNIFLGTIVASISEDSITIFIVGSWILLFNVLILLILALRHVVLIILAMLFPFTIFLWYLDFPFTKSFGMSLMRWTFMWSFMTVIFVLVAGASQIAISSYYDNCSVYSQLGLVGTTATAVTIKVVPKLMEKIILMSGKKYAVITQYTPEIIGGAGAGAFLFADRDCGMTIFLSLTGTILMIAAPFMMIGLLKWIGGAMVMYGFSQFRKPHGELFTLAGGIIAGMGPASIIMYGTQRAFRAAGIGQLPSDKTLGGVNRATLNSDIRRQRITGLKPDELKEFDTLRVKADMTATDSTRINELQTKIGPDRLRRVDKFDEGVKNLGNLENADYWNVRKFTEDFDRWEFRDAFRKGGKIPEIPGKIKGIPGAVKRAGHSAVENVKDARWSAEIELRKDRYLLKRGMEKIPEGAGKFSGGLKGAGGSVVRTVREGGVMEAMKAGAKIDLEGFKSESMRRGKLAGRGLKELAKKRFGG